MLRWIVSGKRVLTTCTEEWPALPARLQSVMVCVCDLRGHATIVHTMKNTPTHTQPTSCTINDHRRRMVAMTCCVAGSASDEAASVSGPSDHQRRHDTPGLGKSCESSNSKVGVDRVASTGRQRGGVRSVPPGACRRVVGRQRSAVICTVLLLLQSMLMVVVVS